MSTLATDATFPTASPPKGPTFIFLSPPFCRRPLNHYSSVSGQTGGRPYFARPPGERSHHAALGFFEGGSWGHLGQNGRSSTVSAGSGSATRWRRRASRIN